LQLERAPIPGERRRELAEVLVERTQVERCLTTALVALERLPVAVSRPLVTTHPVLEQAEVVPGGSIAGVDHHHALVRFDRRFPARRVTVHFRRARKPYFRLLRRRHHRSHHAREERLLGLALEVEDLEVEQRLARPRVEALAILRHDHPVPLEDEPEFGQWLLSVRGETTHAVERLADLPHRGASLQK